MQTRRDGVWIHYRLAPPADQSAHAAFSAAIHAVGHAPATRTDQERLGTRANREGTRKLLPVIQCCGTTPELVHEEPSGPAGPPQGSDGEDRN